ncbi:MAG TPA: cytochrome P460 family protein [Thermoanaerobaculia bacterium]|nr:cytochrome P460 family protein [Thermoanaerobaculia bacterium]
MRTARLLVALSILAFAWRGAADCKGRGPEANLPRPSSIPPEKLGDYEELLLDYLQGGKYTKWCVDKGIRDTGPWINNVYYGTHKAARIYYSPAVIRWLVNGRKGVIPDGAMIIKEGIKSPAARYENTPPPPITDWTIMIRDSKGSKDGWFWAEIYKGMVPDRQQYPFSYPNAGFGLYCVRCHASAEKEMTFSSLNNIKGFPGDFLTFRVDDTWRDDPRADNERHSAEPQGLTPLAPIIAPNPEFLQTFRSILPVLANEVQRIPNETWDDVPSTPKAPQMFLTSNQCLTCHSAANGVFGPTMFLPLPDGGGVNVSEYTEWRWSPMGLAGRDPIFYAQLDSELSYIDTIPDEAKRKALRETVINTCFRCHGVMGKRQFDIDHPGQNFVMDYVLATGSMPGAKYGALARDGISCASCHHIRRDVIPPDFKKSPLEYFLEHSITGLFQTGPANELFGPFKDDEIVTVPMDNALGIKPKYNEYIKSSRMCGHCHTINLPVVDSDKPGEHSLEQTTYLEWLNSTYQNEFGKPGPNAKSCQDCHMPRDYVSPSDKLLVSPIQTRIAIVQDDSYPASEHRAPLEDIRVRFRESGYARHELLGMNGFLLEIFNQFNDILGVRKVDYMTGRSDALDRTIQNLVRQAQTGSATIAADMKLDGSNLTSNVTVTNLAGHRFPSGVGFRRLFIEMIVVENQDERERIVWSSGRTNGVGVIVDAEGRPLATEFFEKNAYQRHHEVITSDDQVQIYEELTKDADGNFTTSFIRRDEEVKDNRLLPLGWTEEGPDKSLNGEFLIGTYPKGNAAKDPDYRNHKGTDTVTYKITLPPDVNPANVSVRATLYYQIIPPYYLQQRFAGSNGAATKRLYYLTSNLNLKDTPLEGWKVRVATTSSRKTQ